MRELQFTSQFRKDIRLAERRRLPRSDIQSVIEHIVEFGDAPDITRPHSLTGNWKGFRECHIRPDWLLIYQVSDDAAKFFRTGTHSDLFGK
ncbi:MAG: type II toxin-antitoxin system YafQ family toxin [Alphaproteobacteria bacterium]|jgi:mRNA interferase YafQ